MKLLLSIILILIAESSKAQTVQTQFGQIQGIINGKVYQFIGIPFAKPPVDTLRWKAPLNPDNWEGLLNTTKFAPECPQKRFEQGGTNDTIIGNEDCLYLNIWSPKLAGGSLPVMVYIHGGGNQQGSASQENGGTQMFFGKNLAERGNVVVVTIQYRLGPLGFLVHPGLEAENANGISGNYAVLDQLLALNWVQKNISNFGGDPKKVMLFGESAGGVDVGNLLTTPLASRLFQRACIQSAVPVIGDYSTVKNNGISYVDSFTTTGTDLEKIAYMRKLPAEALVKFETPPIEGGAVGMNWQAVVDRLVFTDYPYRNVQNGNFNKVPLIIGTNAEEMSLSAPPTVFPVMVTALINSTVPAAFRAQAAQIYPPGNSNTEAKKSYIRLLTDAQFTSTTRRTAQCISQNQTTPVYRYFFTHKHTVPGLEALGSYHGMELFYVFNTWEDATLGRGLLFKAQDDSVQNVMLKYWVNFANTGNPNESGLENWPQYQSSTDCFLEIKASPDGSQFGIRTEESDFWDRVVGFLPCSSSTGINIKNTSNDILTVYPNPTNGIINVNSANATVPFRAIIFDFTGKKIIDEENRTHLDLTNFTSGIYLLTVSQGNQVLQAKIVKQ